MTGNLKAANKLITVEVPEALAGYRTDKALTVLLEGYSRAMLQQWIKQGSVLNQAGKVPKLKAPVVEGEVFTITTTEREELEDQPQDIPLDIVYEDETILVINKPAGLVVHPGAGNPDQTLVNGLLFHNKDQTHLPRAGIVHRLDKDTSGLMVVAKTELAHQHLVEQLSARTVKRQYLAIIYGVLVAGGSVKEPIGRHPHDRRKMVVRPDGRTAITHYRVAQRYRTTTLVRVSLETGRTHQIRVHMAFKKYPLVGDSTYGGRIRLPAGAELPVREAIQGMKSQALHATELGLVHPASGEEMSWQQEAPTQFLDLCEQLKQDAESHA